MKTIVLVLVVSLALAVSAKARNYGIAFPEELRSRPDGRIVDGFPASEGQFPYQAFLILKNIIGQRSACGGSLIASNWILTAGHCVMGMSSAEVHLGSISHGDSPVVITSNKLVRHPDYSILGLRNDIALIGLPEDVSFSGNIQPVKLATDPSVTYAGREAIVSGFGLTADGGAVSPTLNYAPVNVITNIICLLSFPLNVRDSVLCTKGVDTAPQGTCNGDSGGPLVLTENGVLKQIGIVSFGSASGCFADSPKGFVRPYHYIPWIEEVTGLDFD